MDFSNMKDWHYERRMMFCRIIQSQGVPEETKRMVQNNPYGLYETPKTYGEDHVCRNDGTWLEYKTERESDGKFKYKIYCQDKDTVIKRIDNYLLFLRKVGISTWYEMAFYTYAFIAYKLRFRKGMFNATKPNKDKIDELIAAVRDKDVKDIDMSSRTDTRKYAFDPSYLKTVKKHNKFDRSAYTSKQKKVQKEDTDRIIKENYNPELSLSKNILEFRMRGIKKICKERLRKWVLENSIDNQ